LLRCVFRLQRVADYNNYEDYDDYDDDDGYDDYADLDNFIVGYDIIEYKEVCFSFLHCLWREGELTLSSTLLSFRRRRSRRPRARRVQSLRPSALV
jgi:hypothetical protein